MRGGSGCGLRPRIVPGLTILTPAAEAVDGAATATAATMLAPMARVMLRDMQFSLDRFSGGASREADRPEHLARRRTYRGLVAGVECRHERLFGTAYCSSRMFIFDPSGMMMSPGFMPGLHAPVHLASIVMLVVLAGPASGGPPSRLMVTLTV